MKRRLLISSFDCFGGLKSNSSSLVAENLAPDSSWKAEAVRLPVSFLEAWPSLEAAIKDFRPSVVLALGQGEGRHHISLEKVALNYIDARIPDNSGLKPEDWQIQEGGTGAMFCGLDLKSISAGLGPVVRVSYSAGTYVCNALFYELLRHEKTYNYKSIFIHLPLAVEQKVEKLPALPLKVMTDTIDKLTTQLVNKV